MEPTTQTSPYALKKLSGWQRFRHLVSTHRRASLVIGGLITITIVGAAAATVYALTAPKKVDTPVATVAPKPKPAPVKYYSPLTGMEVADDAATKQAVTAIMIENSPDARPQSGLKSAGVVYEAIAEGGITRFLALYQEAKPQLIGPVRSLREYYVDWLTPYNASVAHVGGSAQALTTVRNGSYRDIDQFFNAGSYWRSTDRYAPHNVYTSFEKLDALNAAKGYTTSSFTGFPRADGKPGETPDATDITINISSSLYNTHYSYDKASNSYFRSEGGAPHNDREAGRIAPTTVIAMNVDMVHVVQDGYREQITTTGSGQATIFQNGTAISATWKKDSVSAQLTFIDSAGKPIPLNRGQTWIAAVPNGSGSTAWK